MHALLRRQLERLSVDAREPPSGQAWQALVDEISRTYAETDEVESLAVLHAIHEAAPDGILVIGPDRRVLGFNRRFALIWGIPPGLLAARDDDKLLSHVLPQMVDPDEFIRSVLHLYDHPGESSREEIRLVDGRVLDRFSAPVPSDRGPCGRVWFFREITAQRAAEAALRELNSQLEQRVAERTGALAQANAELDENLRKLRDTQDQLLHAGRMAAVGTLAAGVAHEINNPLTFVMNNLGFIREQLDALFAAQTDPVRSDPGAAAGPGRRGRRRRTGAGHRARPAHHVPSPARAAHARSTSTAPSRPRSASPATSCATGRAWCWNLGPVPPVSANEARLGQVFLNLVVNAAQALPEEQAHRNEIRVASRLEQGAGGGRGGGQRRGHSARAPAPTVRSLLHHQAGRQGDRPGAVHLPRHRDRPGRADRRRQHGGRGQHLPGGAAGRAHPIRPSASGRPAVPPAPAGPGAGSWCSTTRSRWAKSIRRVLNDDHEVVCARNVREALALLDAAGVFDVVLV